MSSLIDKLIGLTNVTPSKSLFNSKVSLIKSTDDLETLSYSNFVSLKFSKTHCSLASMPEFSATAMDFSDLSSFKWNI